MPRGWFRESKRHALAAKGIKSGRKTKISRPRSKLSPVYKSSTWTYSTLGMSRYKYAFSSAAGVAAWLRVWGYDAEVRTRRKDDAAEYVVYSNASELDVEEASKVKAVKHFAAMEMAEEDHLMAEAIVNEIEGNENMAGVFYSLMGRVEDKKRVQKGTIHEKIREGKYGTPEEEMNSAGEYYYGKDKWDKIGYRFRSRFLGGGSRMFPLEVE